jgi:uncharacterized protein YndB with AHSA1/START domain
MPKDLICTARITINASSQSVWKALTDPAAMKVYFFGATVVADWRVGGSVIWQGEWQGKPYADKGTVLEFVPLRKLAYSHFSPLAGKPDLPENYHNVTVELSPEGNQTQVALSQDNNANEAERTQSQQNWQSLLAALKKLVEEA